MPFLKEMLFEAVYWRAIARSEEPSLEHGLAASGVSHALSNWGKRAGDVAVIASINAMPIGAAWYRFWRDDNCIRGHIDSAIPTLVIAVHGDYRCLGVGQQMIEWLVCHASKHSIEKISLMVSTDNQALNLYRKCGFVDYKIVGDSILMTLATQHN
jgi:GNAT superfamily N-acetyltransferase